MRRCLSSCLEETRMWRRTERASLEKKPSTRLSQEPCLGVAQHFGHLFRKLGIALFQVVAHLVRLHFLLIENLAYRALGQVGEACMPLRRSMLAGVAGEKPRRPQFMRIAQFLRLPARQRRQPCFGFDGDRRLLARARAIVQRCHRTSDPGPFYATLNGLMMEAERSAYCKKRRGFPIRQHNPRPPRGLAEAPRR